MSSISRIVSRAIYGKPQPAPAPAPRPREGRRDPTSSLEGPWSSRRSRRGETSSVEDRRLPRARVPRGRPGPEESVIQTVDVPMAPPAPVPAEVPAVPAEAPAQ